MSQMSERLIGMLLWNPFQSSEQEKQEMVAQLVTTVTDISTVNHS